MTRRRTQRRLLYTVWVAVGAIAATALLSAPLADRDLPGFAGVLLALALSGVVIAALLPSLVAIWSAGKQPPTEQADESPERQSAEGVPPPGPQSPAAEPDVADRRQAAAHSRTTWSGDRHANRVALLAAIVTMASTIALAMGLAVAATSSTGSLEPRLVGSPSGGTTFTTVVETQRERTVRLREARAARTYREHALSTAGELLEEISRQVGAFGGNLVGAAAEATTGRIRELTGAVADITGSLKDVTGAATDVRSLFKKGSGTSVNLKPNTDVNVDVDVEPAQVTVLPDRDAPCRYHRRHR